MSIETYQFNLPITPGAIPPVLHLSQYDSGRTFTAVLRDDQGVPFELDASATAVIKGRNAAGIAWQQDCTVSGANVTFTPSGAATDQFGVMPVTIEITESEEVISPLCVIFNIQKAGYTNEEAVLSPDFETAIQAAVAQAISEGGLGFSDEFKEALLACFNAVAWATTGGQALVDDLEAALYPDAHLVSITAAYDQDRPIYDTDSLDLVKLDLVVTANYSDGTSEVVTDYTLSGTLTAGASTITATFVDKSTTFTVTVTSYKDRMSYSMSSGLITKLTGTFGSDSTHGYYIDTRNQNRRVFVYTSGGTKLKITDNGSTFSNSDYYPFPIPANATSVSVAITPNTQYFAPIELIFADGKYTQVANPGWQAGSYTGTLQTGQNRFFLVNSKYNSSGSSYPTDPTQLTIDFS